MGCVQLIAASAITGACELVRYTVGNIGHRTMIGGLQQISTVTMLVLEKMEMHIHNIAYQNECTLISASAGKLDIRINLTPITPQTTRVTVDASQGVLVKDKATADEIIAQIDQMMTQKTPEEYFEARRKI